MIVSDTWGMLLSEAMAEEKQGDAVGGDALVERALILILNKSHRETIDKRPPRVVLVSSVRDDLVGQNPSSPFVHGLPVKRTQVEIQQFCTA
jgi:hypothetical protein